MDLARLAPDDLDEDPRDEAGADADRDVVRQRHEDHREQRRDAVLDVGDVDVLDLGEHQVADEDERGRRGDGRDDPRDRREQDREQEQDARHDRGEAGPAALGDAGRGLDVRRVRADAGAPPTAAASESTSRTRPTPGTEPSSLARPASAATPVTVPIVSKKSVSMIEKIDQDRRHG